MAASYCGKRQPSWGLTETQERDPASSLCEFQLPKCIPDYTVLLLFLANDHNKHPWKFSLAILVPLFVFADSTLCKLDPVQKIAVRFRYGSTQLDYTVRTENIPATAGRPDPQHPIPKCRRWSIALRSTPAGSFCSPCCHVFQFCSQTCALINRPVFPGRQISRRSINGLDTISTE